MKNYFVSMRLIYGIIVYIILVLITGCTPHQEPIPVQRSPIFEWEEQIIPGQTSSSELISIWGEPDEIVKEDVIGESAKGFLYIVSPNNRSDVFVIFDSCDCVVAYSIYILERYHDPYLYLSDLIENYGDPEAVTSPFYQTGSDRNFIYATQGVMITAQDTLEPERSIVRSIQYFEPISLDEYMNSWGEKDVTGLPYNSVWKAYEVSNDP